MLSFLTLFKCRFQAEFVRPSDVSKTAYKLRKASDLRICGVNATRSSYKSNKQEKPPNCMCQPLSHPKVWALLFIDCKRNGYFDSESIDVDLNAQNNGGYQSLVFERVLHKVCLYVAVVCK